MRLASPPAAAWKTAQPHAGWAAARAFAAVVPLDAPGDPAAFAVTRFDAAERVLRDATAFSSARYAQVHGPFKGINLRSMDGAPHRRHRALIAPSFRASMLERWEREIVRPVAHALADRIEAAGSVELVEAFTSRLPVQVICEILGLPEVDHARFLAWSDAVNSGPLDPGAGRAAAEQMAAYFRPLIEARRADPGADLLSALVCAEVEGAALDEAHLLGFLRLLLPAGAETTYRVLGSALVALLEQPDRVEQLRASPRRIPAAVEETLRWETSVTMTVRHAAHDLELDGVAIPEGSAVTVLLASANRDESRWLEPDRWDPERAPLPHLAFGSGAHVCPGLHLARLEIRVALEVLLERFPALRLDPDRPAPRIEGHAFRGPPALAVRLDAPARSTRRAGGPPAAST